RRQQTRWNRRQIAAIQSNRCRVNNEIDVGDLKPKSRFFPTDCLQSRHRTENFRAFKKIPERICKLLSFFGSAVGNDEELAIFFRALKRDRPSGATRAPP